LPFVTIGRHVESTNLDQKSVESDAQALVDTAFGHLYERGSRRLALTAAPERGSLVVPFRPKVHPHSI
jgi:DNA-binding LacI/PurR family transcriptional regulator